MRAFCRAYWHQCVKSSDDSQTKRNRLRAVLCAVLKLTQAEQGSNTHAGVFIGISGLDPEAGYPPIFDMYRAA